MERYNPVDRTFDRLRASLARILELKPEDIHPESELKALIPMESRRKIWQQLRADGIEARGLQRPPRLVTALLVLTPLAAIALALWWNSWFALATIVPIGFAANWASRPWAVHFPLGIRTVGELAFFFTRFGEHKESGHRFTSDEIALKVRMIIAEHLGMRLDDIQRETTWAELGIE